MSLAKFYINYEEFKAQKSEINLIHAVSFILTMRNLKHVRYKFHEEDETFYINYEEFKGPCRVYWFKKRNSFILTMRNLKISIK